MALEWIGETLLPRLLAAGVQSLFVVAAIWLALRWLRPSAALRCWLWWCAALQLLLGALWPAPLELPLLPAQWQRVAEAAAAPAAPQLSPSAQLPYLVTRAEFAAAPAAAAPAADWLSWPALFAALWLAGLIVLGVASARGYLAIRRRVAGARDCEHAPALSAYRALGASLGLRRLPPLRVSAQIDSPQLVGPPATVLLPQRQLAQLSDEELAMALHHELTHLRRRDLWWGWVPALARHLFFFHPLAHVIAREYAIAREQACDAAVLDSRRYAAHDYGRLLLRLGVAPRPAAGVAGASPTYTVLKRRLIMLQNETSAAQDASAQGTPMRGAAARVGGAALIAAVAALGLVPYKVTAAAEEAAMAAGSGSGATASSAADPGAAGPGAAKPHGANARVTGSSVTVNDGSRGGERRITELNNGDARVWAIKGGQYFRVFDDGRYEPVRDAATRARLDGMQRDAARAEVEAAKARREADRAMREAAAAGAQAERDARQAQAEARRAQAEGERARHEAEQDRAEAMREAEQARRDAAQAQRDAEQARRDAEQGRRGREQAQREAERARLAAEQARRQADQRQRDHEQARRDAEQARRAGEQARLDAAQRRRDREQVQRDREQAQRDAAQARRDAGQAARDARQRALDSAQLRREMEQAARDARQAGRDIAQARREGRIGAADSAWLQAIAGRARLAVQDLDIDAVVREARAAGQAARPHAPDSERIRREALRAAAEAMRDVRRELAGAGT